LSIGGASMWHHKVASGDMVDQSRLKSSYKYSEYVWLSCNRLGLFVLVHLNMVTNNAPCMLHFCMI